MCVPGCMDTVAERLSRRSFFKGAGALALAGGAAAAGAAAPARAATQFSEVVDLTHTFGPEFPTFFGVPGIEQETMYTLEEAGFNMKRWSLIEHAATHIDAPIHFSEDGQTAEEVPVENLVAPLAVIDIREKADGNPDAQVTPEDIKAWEAANGPIPERACVAMNSGWADHAGDPGKFTGKDDDGGFHFPGFHVDAARYLLEETSAIGLAVDTLSLDYGPSQSFDTHYSWLPTNRWGLENLANLSALPPAGATLVVGAPKVAGATGGPSRLIALV